MSEQPLLPEPEAAVLRIDAVCDRFEDAWIAGGQPRIEDCLNALPEPERSELLRELILLDAYYRRQSGDGPQPADYHVRFPGLDSAWLEGAIELSRASRNQPVIPILPGPWPPAEAEPPVSDPVAALTPPQIGRYRVDRILGEGGFGRVYLAHDDQLNRPVAIKVPHRKLVARPEDVEAYLTEAQNVAQLDHAHIVPVYDVGGTEHCPCFIVSKFIEGCTLAKRIKEDRPSFSEAAKLVATVGEALHCAHRKGLVHRDIKPGNILLDDGGKPHIADFGLALKEENVGQGPKYAGTPAYMSPEQARGEGHRVDGRSDIFSLGVVFYELLTGRRPFKGNSREELLEQVTDLEPRPPRQYDDSIPKELERICHKALAKRAVDRYSTAIDLVDDLRHFLAEQAVNQKSVPGGESSIAPWATVAMPSPSTSLAPNRSATPPSTPATPTSDSQPLKIVPKGLRSFDAQDADFFLELLPGPRDRQGLPDSLRFWKTRIEESDPDNTFSVGLIYGPSGCGKSSLVKAGLLPRLSDMVMAVYVEATGAETETRLLNGLRKRCPALPVHLGLKETLAALRRSRGIPAGKKVLIVLDQFEQWLHAKREEHNTELVQALRQCDGGRVQCLVLVRDDFWLTATRFLGELEIALLQGQNTALADLFDLDHAKKVLAAFGRAFGKLPATTGETTKEQRAFLKQAVSGLAQEGKVICVRLALFAEMMKGKPWTPASLKQVGGTEGIGVTFLEETFTSPTANPKHRLYQKAARAVLKALLPESGTDIKGHMRSHAELLEASGYASRPKEFDELLHMLDSEIRLLTPTDPEGADAEGQHLTTAGGKYYQLTHDYLVPSLREWLTRKQKETRRGRAELRLAERAALWNSKAENRHLPTWWEWANIRLLTNTQGWTTSQRKMMRKAGRYHALRGLVVAVVLALIGWGGYEGHARIQAHSLRGRLLDANTNEVPTIVRDMAPYRRWLDPLLREANHEAEAKGETRKRLHTSLALFPMDSSQFDYLYERLLNAGPEELKVIRDALKGQQDVLVERLPKVLASSKEDPERRLRAACALAGCDVAQEEDGSWQAASSVIANQLLAAVQKNPSHYPLYLDLLRPVRTKLLSPLAEVFRSKQRPDAERYFATSILAEYAAKQPDFLAHLLMDGDAQQFAMLFQKLKGGDAARTVLNRELDKALRPEWKDTPLSSSWQQPDAGLLRRIEAGLGFLSERFAFCQTMPLADFLTVAEGLHPSGYRPTRFRPYAVDKAVQVAAVWTRDGQPWRIGHGLSAEALQKQDEAYRKEGFLPADVTSYLSGSTENHAALWVQPPAKGSLAQFEIGLSKYSGENYLGDLQVDVQVSKAGRVPTTANVNRHYAALWHPSTQLTSQEVHGLDPAAHLARCRSLLAENYRLASVSVTEIEPGQPLVTASVWHRPVVPDEDKEKLAKRKAAAAVALLKMGDTEKVWPLLRHQPDPRVRSYVVNWLSPLGAKPGTLWKRLEEERDVSSRRALLLSLGDFQDPFQPPEQERVIMKVLDLYQDPDPGVHGAAEWLLRQWKQQDKLKEIDEQWGQQREQRQQRIKEELARDKDRARPKWYVTGHGQTMVVVRGPVDFWMGSPSTEAGRYPRETLHRQRIGRTFAIAAKSVTVEQFRRYLMANAEIQKEFDGSSVFRCNPGRIGGFWIG